MRVELIWEANELVGAIIVSSIFASLATTLTNLNDRLLLGINSLAGRSWLFDSTVAFFSGQRSGESRRNWLLLSGRLVWRKNRERNHDASQDSDCRSDGF